MRSAGPTLHGQQLTTQRSGQSEPALSIPHKVEERQQASGLPCYGPKRRDRKACNVAAIRNGKRSWCARGRAPNVTFESYIESRKLSVPRARPARTASRPARLEAALASPQLARTKGVRRQPPGLSMPMRACVWHRLPSLARTKGVRRQPAQKAARLSVQKLRFPRWSRPHSFVHSEHQPKGVRRHQKGRKDGPALVCPQRAPTKRSAPAAESDDPTEANECIHKRLGQGSI